MIVRTLSVSLVAGAVLVAVAGCGEVAPLASRCPKLDRDACIEDPSCTYVDQAWSYDPVVTGCYPECRDADCAPGTTCTAVEVIQDPSHVHIDAVLLNSYCEATPR